MQSLAGEEGRPSAEDDLEMTLKDVEKPVRSDRDTLIVLFWERSESQRSHIFFHMWNTDPTQIQAIL
jgi:hypothetical protein